MPIYNKLVRDLIPMIIEESGKKYTSRVLSDDEFYIELKKKANEEMEEFFQANNNDEVIEELSDLLEVISALAEYHGFTLEEVQQHSMLKRDKRGAFKEKVFLVKVED